MSCFIVLANNEFNILNVRRLFDNEEMEAEAENQKQTADVYRLSLIPAKPIWK